MAQFARPAADTLVGSWTNQANATTNLWQSIDEDPASETDFVQSSLTVNDDYECRLTQHQAGIIKRGYILRYRGRKNQAAGNTRGVIIELRQGTTVIASNTHADLTVLWLDGFIALTPEQANQITNYADLRVRFRATGTVSGSASVRRRVQISWVQLRIPDWQPTWETDWGAEEDTSTPGVVRLTLNGITGEGPTREDAAFDLWAKTRAVIQYDSEGYELPENPVNGRRYWLAHYIRKRRDYQDLRTRLLAGTVPIPEDHTLEGDLAIIDGKLSRFEPLIASLDAEDRAV